MSHKIEEWIKKRVGVCLVLDNKMMAQKLYSGFVFYHLLRSYNVINDNCLDPPKRYCSGDEALWNLMNLTPWLKLVGVSVNPNYLLEVSQKNKKYCMRLLLDLYNRMEDQNCLHLITNQMRSQILSKDDGRFIVLSGEEPKINQITPHPDEELEWPLIQNRELITKYKDHKRKLDEEYKEQVRIRKLKMAEINEPLKISLPKIPKKYQPKNREDIGAEAEDPIKAFVDSCQDRKIDQELYLNCTPKEHVAYLKKKKDTFLANELLKQKMHLMIIHDMWVDILNEKDTEFETFLETRLKQQSECEKKQTLRMARTHNNYKSFYEQKQIIKDVTQVSGVDEKEPLLKMKGEEREIEKKRLLELYKKFQEDEKIQRQKNIQETCSDIISDIIDISVYISERQIETGGPLVEVDILNYKSLFYQGVFNSETEEIQNTIRKEVLNKYYSEAYIKYMGPWCLDKLPESELKESLKIHGYVIHRLLEFKYPFPNAPIIPKFSHFKIRSVLRNFYDQEFLSSLKALLKRSNVEVVTLNDALNYCLQIYENEKHLTPFGRTLRINELQNVVGDIEEVQQFGNDDKKKYFGRRLVYHKAIQVPSYDDLHRRNRHSTPALLGKIAFETLNRGELMDEVLSTRIILEYLKSLNSIGFVLINYPNSISQAALLEYLITGKPVEINFPVKYDDKEFLFKEMKPPLIVDTFPFVDFENRFFDFIEEKTFSARETILPMFPKIQLVKKTTSEDEVSNEPVKRRKKSNEDDEYKTVPVRIERESITEPIQNISLHDLVKMRTSKILPRPSKIINPASYYQTSIFQTCIANLSEKSGKEVIKQRCSSLFADLLKPEVKKEIKIEPTNEKDPLKLVALEKLPSPLIFYKYYNIQITFADIQGNIPVKKIARVILNEPDEPMDPFRRNTIDLFGQKALDACSRNVKLTRSISDIDILKAQVHETPKEIEADLLIKKMDKERRELALKEPEEPKEPEEIVEPLQDNLQTEKMTETAEGDVKPKRRGSKKSIRRQSKKSIRRKSKKSIRRQSKKSIRRQSKKSIRRQSKKSIRRQSRKQSARRQSSRRSSGKKGGTSHDKHKSESSEQEEKPYTGPKPGEENWNYINFPIPDNFQVALASVWEAVEHFYLQNLNSNLEMIRIQKEKITPFKTSYKNALNEYLNSPDERLNIVNNFQLMYNDIDNELRKEPEMKAELHFKVHELKKILTNLVLEKASTAIRLRDEFSGESWALNYCVPLANAYIDIMQIESDRFIDTINILNDYYSAMLKVKLEDLKTLEKVVLAKLPLPVEDKVEALHEAESDLSLRKKKKKKYKSSSQKRTSEETITTNEHNIFDSQGLTSTLESTINEAATKAKHIHNKIQDNIKDENLGKELIEFLKAKEELENKQKPKHEEKKQPKSGGRRQSARRQSARRQSRKQSARRQSRKQSARRQSRKQSARRQSRKQSARRQSRKQSARRQSRKQSARRQSRKQSTRRKSTSRRQSSSKGQPSHASSAKTSKSVKSKIKEIVALVKMEWSTAVQNEQDRLLLRLKLAENKLKQDISEISKLINETTENFPNSVHMRLDGELKAIENLCTVLKAAIEDESLIQPLLILDKDVFYIDRSNLLMEDKPPPPPVPLNELKSDSKFTIKQLNQLVGKLNYIAPNGIVQESLIATLDHLSKTITEIIDYLPAKWGTFDHQDIERIINTVYSSSGILDWKDFILFNLGIPNATFEDLVDLKDRYTAIDKDNNETITYEEFMNIPLWFDKDFGKTIYDDLRYSLAKDLIFKLFQTNDQMNYTQLLLAFCKNEDIRVGFLNALVIMGGNKIVRDMPCYQVPPKQYIEAKVVIDQIMEKYYNDLNEKLDFELKILPSHDYQEIYSSADNEYINSEKILAENKAKTYSNDSIIEKKIKKEQESEIPESENILYKDIGLFLDPRWQYCIPFNLLLTLLTTGTHLYGISPDHLHKQLCIEDKLKALYEAKGKDGYIKAINFGASDLFKQIFESIPTYKLYDIDKIVETILIEKLIEKQNEQLRYEKSEVK